MGSNVLNLNSFCHENSGSGIQQLRLDFLPKLWLRSSQYQDAQKGIFIVSQKMKKGIFAF
jgi:hypothetical protein